MSKTVKKVLIGVAILAIGILAGVILLATSYHPETKEIIKTEKETEEIPTNAIVLSEDQVPTLVENDRGELTEEIYPTVEEVDGGKLEDQYTGLSQTEAGNYQDLGWTEDYDVSSPEAFKNATLGRCIIANNIFGAQCVSLARVFWWSYADRDVSTCGTGAAKGMVMCPEVNAGDEFVFIDTSDAAFIQTGDWLIFTGGLYGHVGMALGPSSNGYVALLGENQGGPSCGDGIGGSGTNIINLNTKNLIGIYRPKAYEKTEPEASDTQDIIPDASH